MTTRFVERAQGWITATKVTAAVELKNLFGTPAAGHTVQASYTLSPWTPSFSRYADYQFFDPSHARKSEEQRLEDATTDDEGNAQWTVDLSSWAPATYHVSLYAEGMELGGGRSVSGVAGVVVSPRRYLLGFKASGDLGFVKRESERTVELIAIDSALERVRVEKLKAVLVEQRYVSVLTREGNGSYRYQSVLQGRHPRRPSRSRSSAKGTTLTLRSSEVGSFYLSLRDEEDVELLRIPYTVVGEGNLAKDLEKNAELKVSLDKADYEPRDTIAVQITAPYAGRGCHHHRARPRLRLEELQDDDEQLGTDHRGAGRARSQRLRARGLRQGHRLQGALREPAVLRRRAVQHLEEATTARGVG